MAVLRAERYTIEPHGLKTAPRGYPRDHPRCRAAPPQERRPRTFTPAAWLGTKGAATRITGVWRAAAPVNAWLVAHVGPSTEPPPERWRR